MTGRETLKCDELLVEIGTEELPPRALQTLAQGFATAVQTGLEGHGLHPAACLWYATPRRLAVQVQALPEQQAEQQSERLGPWLHNAYNSDGTPTPAMLGFARSVGVSCEALETHEGPRGKRVMWQNRTPGQKTITLLPEIICKALDQIPMGRRMRWGEETCRFVRPVRWAVVLYGDAVVPCQLLGCQADRSTRGHRFHHPEPIQIAHSRDYLGTLLDSARVRADYHERKAYIQQAVESLARDIGGQALIEPALLDEVTALNEWPVALSGAFDKEFLELPREILIATLQTHQRYFPVQRDQTLMARFIFISNIEAEHPERIVCGNERVVRPRLADARFFYRRDSKKALEERINTLRSVTWQARLGSLYDKTQRLRKTACWLAETLDADIGDCDRAAALSKCDLLSDTVGEFPQLQGVVGSYLALRDGEKEAVSSALREHYLPRFANDRLPSERTAQILAVADRLDHLLGNGLSGHLPGGDKDPYSLRRAALGLVRIVIECALDVDLQPLLAIAMSGFPTTLRDDKQAAVLQHFILERLRSWCLDQGHLPEHFEAVLAVEPNHLLAFYRRLQAVKQFCQLPEADKLTTSNKRIRKLLRKTSPGQAAKLDRALLRDDSEHRLDKALESCRTQLTTLLQQEDYLAVLSCLATLQDSIDAFFDDVLILCEDSTLRNNRLALLAETADLFLIVADLSRLPGKTSTASG